MKTITLTANPDGTVKIETTGYAGSECQQATKELEKMLGMHGAAKETLTPEFFAQKQEQQNYGRNGQ